MSQPSKLKTLFKGFLKILGILVILIIAFVIYFVIVNTSGGQTNEEILAELPKEISEKYPADPENTWWKTTSVYQIYPRSFKDSDGDGIGDIKGILSELDYIKSMGFETIWFSPFFKSPQYDHGYDISNYREIEPAYGNMQDVDSLIAEIHKRDMKIVLDMVLNHTSDKHPWFLESKSSKDNPKSDWYVWRDGKEDGPPNNWKNIPGSGSGWTYVPERDQYYYAAFMPRQPDLNMSNPEVQAEILDMTRFWLDKGVDGFRLDIFNFIFEDERYPDNPFTLRLLPDFEEAKWLFEEHKYNYQQPETVTFAKELRAVLESYERHRFMVGEVFGSHKTMRDLLGEEHDGLNMVFLFDFLESFEFSASYFREKVETYESFYPYPLVPTYVFSNHDQFRSITRLDNNMEKADVLAAFQLTMRGVPFVYQGEEIGMRTGNISLEDAQDPLAENWKSYPQFIIDEVEYLTNRDNTRTPMQWNKEMNAGFSTNKDTWLPVQENYPEINVESSMKNENSLLHTYRNILQLRNNLQALQHGKISFIDNLPEDVLGYKRGHGKDEVSIYLNFSDQPRTVTLSAEGSSSLYAKRAEIQAAKIGLEGFGIMIIE